MPGHAPVIRSGLWVESSGRCHSRTTSTAPIITSLLSRCVNVVPSPAGPISLPCSWRIWRARRPAGCAPRSGIAGTHMVGEAGLTAAAGRPSAIQTARWRCPDGAMGRQNVTAGHDGAQPAGRAAFPDPAEPMPWIVPSPRSRRLNPRQFSRHRDPSANWSAGYGRGLGGAQDPQDGGRAAACDLLDARQAQPCRACLAHGVVATAALPVAQLLGGPILCGRAFHNGNGISPGGYALPRASFKVSHLSSSGSAQCPAQDRGWWQVSTPAEHSQGVCGVSGVAASAGVVQPRL